MNDNKKYKVGITVKEPWADDISYEELDMVLFAVEDGGDGCSYVALKPNIGVTPGSDSTVWVKSTQAGQSIYDLAVKYHHFDGTEEEFEAQYQAILAAAAAAASAAAGTNREVQAAEALRNAAERERAGAENLREAAERDRATNESARVSNELSRAAAELSREKAEKGENLDGQGGRVKAESDRVSAENTRVSAENARAESEDNRVREWGGLKTDVENARDQADAAASKANAAAGRAPYIGANGNWYVWSVDSSAYVDTGVRAIAPVLSADSSGVIYSKDQVLTDVIKNAKDNADEDHARAGEDHTRAERDHESIASKVNVEDLCSGAVIPKLSSDFESWNEGSAPTENSFSEAARTTAGETSVVSSKGVDVMRIVARHDFYASSLRFTGKNLLRDAIAVGDGYYFLVPALPFGAFGTAMKPNGLLFVNSEGANLTPTVFFKPLASGIPTSATDGTACAYTDSNGLRFYNPAEVGYIIVSDINLATTCARVAWSGNGFPYNRYIAIDNAEDAGFSFALSTVIHAMHSYDKMLVAGDKADYIDRVSESSVRWHRVIERIQPTWSTIHNEDDTYTHTATIADMAADGDVEFENEGIDLTVAGKQVSYTDSNATASSNYVKYELATEVTGVVNTSTHGLIEDFGLEVLTGIIGSAYITLRYYQSYQDAVRALIDGIFDTKMRVIAEAFNSLNSKLSTLECALRRFGDIGAHAVDAFEFTKYNAPLVLFGEGAPSANTVPLNWPPELPWDGIPVFKGEFYIDVTAASGGFRYAKDNTAVSDWVNP